MYKIFSSLLGIIFIFSSCYKYPEIDYDYQNYNRVVGAEGGNIVFYANYSSDSLFHLNGVDSSSKILELNVPAGALDTDVVFNFYQYQSINTAQELSKGLANIGSKFIYFVPVFASDGYHVHDNADLTYHLSLKFNKPVTVKYYYGNKYEMNTIDEKKLKFEFYDRLNLNYKLYRLKIPEIDEWGMRNIFVQWNQQGYPIGYNSTDIEDIILGLWFPFSDADEYKSSLTNWEEVENLTFNSDNSFSFDINNTDYIYVLAQITNIPIDKLPLKITNYLQSNYGIGIERAGFVNQEFQIILENGYIVYFQRNGDLDYAEKYNLPLSDIPLNIKAYINSNYSGENIKTNLVRIYPSLPNSLLEYSVTLTNNDALLFSGDSSSIAFDGKIIYGYDDQNLSSNIIDYINSNFTDVKIQNVILNDVSGNQFYVVFIKYENRTAKLYFDFTGVLWYTVYYGLKQDEISNDVNDYLNQLFPNVDLVSINLVYTGDSSFYDVELLNNAFVEISETADLYYADYYVLQKDIPSEINDSIASRFVSNKIVESYYHYETGDEYYWISFLERLNVAVAPDGTVLYAEGRNFNDLPPNAKIYIINNYSALNFSDFYYLEDNSTGVLRYVFHVSLLDGTILLFNRDGNFIQLGKSIINNSKYKRTDSKLLKF